MKILSPDGAAALISLVTRSQLAAWSAIWCQSTSSKHRGPLSGHRRTSGSDRGSPLAVRGSRGTGMNRWAHGDMLRRTIGSTFILPPDSKTSEFNKLVLSNSVEAYCWPANAIFQMLRAVGAGRVGYISEVGVDTFADPRRQGGTLNRRTPNDLIKLVTIDGREHLLFPAIPIDVALIRASTADTEGNLFCDQEGLTQGILVQATAAHNSGGIVTAQVRQVVEAGTMHPLMTEVPGLLVDAVVVHEGASQFEYGQATGDLPATTGARRRPSWPDVETLGFGPRKIIARRALMEVRCGHLVNLGAGVSAGVHGIAAEEGVYRAINWTFEHGVLGGRPLGMVSWNPTAITSPTWLLDFYNGGGLDQSFLAMGEVDQAGNVNVARLGDQLQGTGGFTDISAFTRKVTFCGTMTSGRLEVRVDDGQLVIAREGDRTKFVRDCDMVCFSGVKGLERGSEIKYVTERAVFELHPGGLVLREVAPGIDVQSQILDLCKFPISVSPDLRLMDSRLFQVDPMGLTLGDSTARGRSTLLSAYP